MKKNLLALSILLFLILFVMVSCQTTKQSVSTQDLLLDIQRIQMDMEYSALKDLYDPEPFEQIKVDLANGKIDRKECIYRLKEILCSYHVAHLRLTTTKENKDFSSSIMPFVFLCFGNDYHVFIAAKQYEEYLGAKVLEIGNVPVQEALEKISKYIAYETPSGLKYSFETSISYETLNRVGLTESNGKIKIKLQKDDGTIDILNCKPVFIPKTEFCTQLPKTENPVNTMQDISCDYCIKTSKENDTIYVHFNRVWCNTDYLPKDLFEDLMKEIDSDLYKTIVFDLRYNGGGSPEIVFMLSHLLYDNKAAFEKYNLATITTGRTASAACWFLNELLRIFPQIVIFGEETGEAIFNYTDIPYSNVLKYLQCNFAFPHQIDDHVDELYKRAEEVTHSDIHRGTMPDVEVYAAFENWLNGEDTIYNTIFEYFR